MASQIQRTSSLLPVDAAAAPISIGGIAKIRRTKTAIQLVSFAVAEEEDDKVLW